MSSDLEKIEDDDQFLKKQRVVPCLPSVTERYYRRQTFHPSGQEDSSNDLLILCHSNRISLVTLSPNHEIIKLNKTVQKIDFNNPEKKTDRLKNKVTGKRKKGGQYVQAESFLCSLDCSDGSSYKIHAGLKGKLIEINKQLLERPELITSKTWSDGYLAIILPPFQSKQF